MSLSIKEINLKKNKLSYPSELFINGKYQKSTLFGDGNSGKRIAEILSNVNPKIQKRISYLPDDLIYEK